MNHKAIQIQYTDKDMEYSHARMELYIVVFGNQIN